MSARYQPIDGHPGFYRHGSMVAFRYRDRRARRRWASAPTIRAAEHRRAELETDARRGLLVNGGRETFESYGRPWIEAYAGRTSGGLKESTRDDYRGRLELYAYPFLGAMRLAEISPADVRALGAHVAAQINKRTGKPLGKNSVRLALAPVKVLLATAREDGLISTNPAAGVRVVAQHPGPTPQAGLARAWSPDEFAALLSGLPARVVLFAVFLVETGLRIGEAVELRKRDFDLGKQTVTIERNFYRGRVGSPKHGRVRTLRLRDDRSRELWPILAKLGDDDLVFVSEKRQRVDSKNLASRIFAPAARAAGVEWDGWHRLRHTCASAMFREGRNVKQVSVWLGHTDPAFTLRLYVHLLPEDIPEPAIFAADALAVRPICDHLATHTPRTAPKAANA